MSKIRPISKLCLGGTFNPIHLAHLLCARSAAEALGLGGVVLIPARNSPHKALPSVAADTSTATPEDRLAMCKLAIEGLPGFEVDDCELQRPAPSFTIDTVRELVRRGWPKVHWLLGADQAFSLPTWHLPHQLMKEAHIIVMARPGYPLDWTKLPPEFRGLSEHVVGVPDIDISSTDIRRRVASGLPIDLLTPPAVCRYIAEHSLYRPNKPSTATA